MTYTLENYLAKLHKGQWFGWSDSKNKIYANLIIHDDTKSKPSEADCNAGVAALQKAYDDAAYQRSRAAEYPSIGDQLDMIYHNGDGGATFQAAIKAVKDKYPKE
jgi:hypothetical protein